MAFIRGSNFLTLKPLLAIAWLSIQNARRSLVVVPLLLCTVAGAVGLPALISGDGTAAGYLQIALTYTIGYVSMMLSLATVWMGCTLVGDAIGRHRIHLVATKPVSSLVFLAGHWLGICVLQAMILGVAAITSYHTIMQRLTPPRFAQQEIDQLRRETLAGRRRYTADTVDLREAVEREFQRRTDMGAIPAGADPTRIRAEIQRQVRLRLAEIPENGERSWTFRGLPAIAGDNQIHLRYRLYIDNPSTGQDRETTGVWMLRNPTDQRYYPVTRNETTGITQELPIPSDAIDANGAVELRYQNRDPSGASVIFQEIDGPHILIRHVSFPQNFLRVIAVIFSKLIFLAILSCAAGALFSTPSAVVFSLSYVGLGMLLLFIRSTFPDMDALLPANFITHAASIVRAITGYLTISLNEFQELSRLAKGELLEGGRMASIVAQLLLIRGLPIGLVGGWCLHRRELGLVVKT